MATPEGLKDLAANDPHIPLWHRIVRIERILDILLSVLYKGDVHEAISKEDEKFLDDFQARFKIPASWGVDDE